MDEHKANLLSSLAMPPATCRVSYRDPDGMEHAVEIAAESLHEAALRGLLELGASGWLTGGNGAVVVEVHGPVVRHTVPLDAIRRALERPARTPAELSRQRGIQELWEALKKPMDT